ncbi:MAG: uncharacterized protein PWQ29_1336 [Verrucomicrobiota bacterium]|jgi:uncharacterized protein YqgC (DUF456 family)|nr:uncharacterized protein [Verrucomicrobiota bacterium]MDK2963942.1 uncharacterized protein [Verrucomicrobiota bacterium]
MTETTDVLLLVLTAFLCLSGLLLSTLAFSGTWLVLAAALVTKFSTGFPSLGTLIVFTLLCIAAEIFEALAAFLGVQKRGGSHLAGLAALVGGLIGAGIGTGILPIFGTFAGMLIGSFAAAFLTEWLRLQHYGQAAHIAWGTVWAKLAVLFIKTALTFGMSIWLLAGLIN